MYSLVLLCIGRMVASITQIVIGARLRSAHVRYVIVVLLTHVLANVTDANSTASTSELGVFVRRVQHVVCGTPRQMWSIRDLTCLVYVVVLVLLRYGHIDDGGVPHDGARD